MSSKRYLLFLLALVLIFATVVYGQETPTPEPESAINIEPCDYDALADRLIIIAENMRDENDDQRLNLLRWTASVQTFRAECDGYVFRSEVLFTHFIGDSVKAFNPASFLNPSNSRGLKSAKMTIGKEDNHE